MPTRLSLLFLSLVCITHCTLASETSNEYELRPETCALGHRTLREIPIMYGMLLLDDDLKRRLDKKEVWSGGCMRSDEATKLYCDTCDFAYNSFFDYWKQTSRNPDDFKIRLDSLILNFPETEGFYIQSLSEGVVMKEYAQFSIADDINLQTLKDKHLEYLEGAGLTPIEQPNRGAQSFYEIFAKHGEKYLKLSVDRRRVTHAILELVHVDEAHKLYGIQKLLQLPDTFVVKFDHTE